MTAKPTYKELEKRVEALERKNADLQKAVQVLGNEIKTREETEKRLAKSREKYRSLVETMNDGLAFQDKDYRLTFVNKKLAEILGYPVEEVVGRDPIDFLDDVNRRILQNRRKTQKKGMIDSYEMVYQHREGRPVYVIISPKVFYDREGNPEGYLSVVTDITKRKQAEMAVQESETHLRSLMENATYFALYRLVADDERPEHLRVVFVSPSIDNIMGVSDPMKFETWFDNIHPEDETRVMEANLRAFKTGRFNETMRIYHPEKRKWRWIQTISNGLIDENGGPVFVNGILLDVSKKKQAEIDLQVSTDHLREVNAALKVLLKRREEDRKLLEERVLRNVRTRVFPHLEKMRKEKIDDRVRAQIDLIESTINDVVSPFVQTLSTRYWNLSPTEIQIADLVKQGKRSKDIAHIMGVSKSTIDTHRNNIRKKLKIVNKGENLRTRLLTFQ